MGKRQHGASLSTQHYAISALLQTMECVGTISFINTGMTFQVTLLGFGNYYYRYVNY